MNRQTLTNWALAVVIIIVLALVQQIDGPDDLQTERAIAADLADAQAQARAVVVARGQP